MIELLRREFTVNVPLEVAWQHLARVEQWPSWAKHIKRVEAIPPGELTSSSIGHIHLRNGIKSAFKMSEFKPPRNWKWVGPFLWLAIHYDHIFEPVDSRHTKLVWIVAAEGFGVSIFGKLFAAIYNGNLNKAVPRLIAEVNTTRS